MNTKETIMLEEYKLIKDECKHYFEYAYKNLSIIFAFFSAAVVFGFDTGIDYFPRLLIFLYIVPICGYVFGLLYFYCFSALAKLGYSEALLEAKLKEKGLSEYTKRSKQYKLGYFLAYGTSFAFFLLVPVVSILIGSSNIEDNTNLFFHQYSQLENIFLYKACWGFYIIYIIFSVLIFIEMGTVIKKTKMLKYRRQ